ncbi:transmembrane protein 119 [Electrophorus electricus]|uniref:Transmembrane protein 119a n=2 Tax=Electrophorus TaxID=8004 RepID=A0A4W4HLY2_ELEEL|nr:transmembrane protein 119 [Electrophorus electricus]
MPSSTCSRLAVTLLLMEFGWCCLSLAFPISESVEGSADEPELIFPTAQATHVVPPSPSPVPSITTTFIRVKDFLFNQVVDILRDNLLLIIVVTSLLIVIIFIICCASALSHKRKLEAYYPPRKSVPRKYMCEATKGVARQQQRARPGPEPKGVASGSASCLRTPSKALVGEKEGKEPPARAQQVQRAEEVREVEEQREEKKKGEEPKPSTLVGGASQALVCTCHLRKASPSAQ